MNDIFVLVVFKKINNNGKISDLDIFLEEGAY